MNKHNIMPDALDIAMAFYDGYALPARAAGKFAAAIQAYAEEYAASISPRPPAPDSAIIRSPCQWCKNSSYFKQGSNILKEPCSSCTDSSDWKHFKFARRDGHASR